MAPSVAICIVGNPNYLNTPGSIAVVAEIVTRFRALLGRVFWPDDISLVDAGHIEVSAVLISVQVTDTYLLTSAVAYGSIRRYTEVENPS